MCNRSPSSRPHPPNSSPDTGEPDFQTLDDLATYLRREGDLLFGAYADVEVPGRVRVSDPIQTLGD